MSEMAYALQVVRNRPTELALLRRHDSETCFGVQLAAKRADSGVPAALAAVERGAAFVDINCGCPIHDVVRRGMGAVLMQRPQALGRLLEEMVPQVPVPITVKLRLGWSEGEKNVDEVARIAEESGARAITIHGRTREQRYSKAADWEAVQRIAADRTVPVIGNGDILTWYEAEDLWQRSGCASVMVGRGALIKPWIFQEIAERRAIEPSAEERVGIYRRLISFMKDHFRDDEKGRKRAMFFLPWHLGFLCRYRPLPEERYREASREHPLMQTRAADREDLSLLEQLLRDPREEVHKAIADALWQAEDDSAAVARLQQLAEEMPPVTGDAEEVKTAHG
jgi:tRNA-dihydrouridine synthase 3